MVQDNAIGAGGLGFDSRSGQIGHSVANNLPRLRCFFEGPSEQCCPGAVEMGPVSMFRNGYIENFHFAFQRSDWLAFAKRVCSSRQSRSMKQNFSVCCWLLAAYSRKSQSHRWLWPITSLESKVVIFYATISKYVPRHPLYALRRINASKLIKQGRFHFNFGLKIKAAWSSVIFEIAIDVYDRTVWVPRLSWTLF